MSISVKLLRLLLVMLGGFLYYGLRDFIQNSFSKLNYFLSLFYLTPFQGLIFNIFFHKIVYVYSHSEIFIEYIVRYKMKKFIGQIVSLIFCIKFIVFYIVFLFILIFLFRI